MDALSSITPATKAELFVAVLMCVAVVLVFIVSILAYRKEFNQINVKYLAQASGNAAMLPVYFIIMMLPIKPGLLPLIHDAGFTLFLLAGLGLFYVISIILRSPSGDNLLRRPKKINEIIPNFKLDDVEINKDTIEKEVNE